MRDKLVSQIAALDATDAAIAWAGRSVGAKNTLTAEDASIVETAFRDRMQVLEPEIFPPNSTPPELQTPPVENAHNMNRLMLPSQEAEACALAPNLRNKETPGFTNGIEGDRYSPR